MNKKKSVVTLSLVFLGLVIFTACENNSVEDNQESLIEVTQGETGKNDVGTIGNSGGDDEDNDY